MDTWDKIITLLGLLLVLSVTLIIVAIKKGLLP
jgi:hypothetical protein